MRIALLVVVYVIAPSLFAACHSTAPSKPPAQAATSDLRILAYNIRHGAGMDEVVELQRAADLIRRLAPDVVTLQEIDKNCRRTGTVDQAEWLGKELGMHAAFGAFMPYQGGDYGMAVLSREPIVGVENIRLPDGAEPRTALAVRTNTPSGELIVVSIHLYMTEAERLAQAEVLIRHFKDESSPVVLAGDFNSQPGSTVMAKLERSWTNIAKTGPSNTFPADQPDREIDFCLLRPMARFADAKLRVIEEALVSDHRPILLEARLLTRD